MREKHIDPFRHRKSQANEWINTWIPLPLQMMIFLIIIGLVSFGFAFGFAYGAYAFVNLPKWLPFWGPIIVLLILGFTARGGIYFLIAAFLLLAVETWENYDFLIAMLWH